MKKTYISLALTSIIASSAFVSTQTMAVEGLSANASVTNNYLWRGVTQTTNAAAVSGGIDYEDKSGFYAGAWTSNADWAPNMSYELDLYGGFSNELSNGIGYDVGFIYYNYDNSANTDFSEVYANISWKFLTVGYATLIDSDSGGEFADDTYISADAAFELTSDIILGLHIGTYDFSAGGDYIEYSVNISKDNFTFTLADTDIDGTGGDVNITVSYTVDFDL
ncbi:MAG: hypothetical protein HRT38_01300 [Alteromonadaceae bacterium]|nr:hypothetical protein [Alteromonadaceae bacterium]